MHPAIKMERFIERLGQASPEDRPLVECIMHGFRATFESAIPAWNKVQQDAERRYGKTNYSLSDEPGLRKDPLTLEFVNTIKDYVRMPGSSQDIPELERLREEFDGTPEETKALDEAAWLAFLDSYPNIFYWGNSESWKRDHFVNDVTMRKVWRFYKELSPKMERMEQEARARYAEALKRSPGVQWVQGDPRIDDPSYRGPSGNWTHD